MLWCIGGNRHTMNLIIPGCKIHHKLRISAIEVEQASFTKQPNELFRTGGGYASAIQ